MRKQQEIILKQKDDLPEGSMILSEFAKLCSVSPNIANNHRSIGLSYRRVYGTRNQYEYLEATPVLEGARVRFYLTPTQQRLTLDYWDRHRIKHRMPIYHHTKGQHQ